MLPIETSDILFRLYPVNRVHEIAYGFGGPSENSLCLKFFSPTCPKAKFRKNFYLFNSIVIFICPNPVLLVPGFRQVG